MPDWRPSASPERVRLRAGLLADIRAFFAERGVLEVETPLLGAATVADVHIDSFEVPAPGAPPLYLQTSPEFAMKRLLAAGAGPIYQICKAFRRGESGRRHNPEFTLLEWYRPGFSMERLMDEVAELADRVLACGAVTRLSYRQAFMDRLGLDPHAPDADALRRQLRRRVEIDDGGLTDGERLQLLMTHCVEPSLPEHCLLYDYPADQAALAAVRPDAGGAPVAKRFELYAKGLELANGYFELTDAAEQRRRFEAELAERRRRSLPEPPMDRRLLAALESGLPACAGVALGVDRLLMLAAGADDIREVLNFGAGRA